MSLKNKKILVGVTGGIAVYKTCSLVNMLIKDGAEVRVVMTEAATKFVSPLTFQALTNHSVYVDMWEPNDRNSVEHISLSHWPDLFVIAPLTANTLAKMASGMADNILTVVVLARLTNTKVLLAPAMNVNMWKNPLVQKNIYILKKENDFVFIDPRSGKLACRDEGEGKIAKNEDILEKVKFLLSKK